MPSLGETTWSDCLGSSSYNAMIGLHIKSALGHNERRMKAFGASGQEPLNSLECFANLFGGAEHCLSSVTAGEFSRDD